MYGKACRDEHRSSGSAELSFYARFGKHDITCNADGQWPPNISYFGYLHKICFLFLVL